MLKTTATGIGIEQGGSPEARRGKNPALWKTEAGNGH